MLASTVALLVSQEFSQTFVFAVSCLDFKSRAFNSIPEGSRSDKLMLAELKKKGVSTRNVVFMTGRAAVSQKIDFEFREILGKVKRASTLFIYYFGHGYIQDKGLQFATYNSEIGSSGWQMSRAFRQIDKLFRGGRIFFVADACKSGLLLDYAKKARTKIAILTSAQGSSDVPEGWDFTQCLVDSISSSNDWPAVLQLAATSSEAQLGIKPTLFFHDSEAPSTH